jgi:hypothetical protein
MFVSLESKLIAGLVAVIAALLLGFGMFDLYGYVQNQRAQIASLTDKVAQEKSNTEAALTATQALGAALDARSTATTAAATRTAGVTTALAAAVAAAPEVASTAVPESYWRAIYGSPNDESKN